MSISRTCWPRLIQALTLLFAVACFSSPGKGQTPRDLLLAAERGDVAGAKSALSAGVPVDTRDGRGRTALLIATHANHPAVARVLIAAGADVNAKDSIEDTPFLYAGAEGRNEILKMTLKAGANLKDTNRYGSTALVPAAHHGHPETVRILLQTKIDIDHINKLGWTALLEAVILGNGDKTYVDIVRQLLAAGANPNIADRDGVTPLQHARKRGQSAIAAMLSAGGGR